MIRALSSLAVAGALAVPSVASAENPVVRNGIHFDSAVGAYCGALNTDIFFQPGESRLEVHDEAPLDYLAQCFTTGALGGASIGLVTTFDGSEADRSLALARQRAVRDYLVSHGVNPDQLSAWRLYEDDTASWEPGRIEFRLVEVASSQSLLR